MLIFYFHTNVQSYAYVHIHLGTHSNTYMHIYHIYINYLSCCFRELEKEKLIKIVYLHV